MLAELIAIVVPVYLCALLGFLWVRSGRHYDTAFMTDMVMLVGAPCLTFSSLVGRDLELGSLLRMVAAVAVATGVMALVAALVLRATRVPISTFLAPMTFGNTGNMGLPLCYFAFGEQGLALGVCFYATTAFLQFTVGHRMWVSHLSLAQLVRTPLIWSTLLALGVVGLELPVPRWLLRTSELMGDFTIPIMQFTLGVSLARLQVVSLRRSFGLSCLKLTMGAAVGFAVARLFGFEGVAAGVLVLDCAMPVAVFNYMFASRYDRDPAEVASVVVLSTLLSFLTLPILLGLLLPSI